MHKIFASFTVQLSMIKLFNLLNAKRGSVWPSLLAQKTDVPRCKQVNAGKFSDLGKVVISL